MGSNRIDSRKIGRKENHMEGNLFSGLSGEKIYFKQLSKEDAIKIHEYASDKDVKKFIGWPLMNTLEETRNYVEKLLDNEKAKTHIYASVLLKESNELIGTVMLFNFDHEANHAEIGYVFNKRHWGKGYCTEAVAMIDGFAANSLKLNKLHARVTDANMGSIKVLEKNSYELEGRLKKYYFIDEFYYDLLLYAKLFK